MSSLTRVASFFAVLTAVVATASAADLSDMPLVEVIPEIHTDSVDGWYLRGDIGYAHVSTDGVDYYQGTPSLTGEFEKYEIDGAWMLAGGIGYQATDYFRVDLTLNHYGKADFDGEWGDDLAEEVDSKISATTLMANAYVDLGNIVGFTPYLGGGLGGAKMHWDDLATSSSDHKGQGGQWRFAYSAHAGVSYDVSQSLKFDAGYTYTRIDDGEMFSFAGDSGYSGPQGYDKGFDIHAVRAGLRWLVN